MKKMIQTLRYLLRNYKRTTFIGFLYILSTLILTDLIFYLTDRYDNVITARQDITLSVPIDITAGIIALLTGWVLFITTFKVSLANGISRKTFLLANIPTALTAAATYSVFNLMLVLISKLFWPIELSSQLFYPQVGIAGLFALQLALYLLLIIVGWFITLVYYRTSVPVKWAISVAPFVLYGLLKVANASTGGSVFEAFHDYLLWSRMFPRVILTLFTYSVIFYGFVYLMFRRIPLKD